MSKILFLNICLFATLIAQAQSNSSKPRVSLDDIIPRTPQSAELMKVNDIAVNTAKGIPQISFTLYTAKVGNQSIPIRISYNAGGIKFDDAASAVGLKWTLEAGGEISRSINGKHDEAYYYDHANQFNQFDISNYWTIYSDSVQQFFTDVANNVTDISQDEFSYNYLDRSGGFYFKGTKYYDLRNPWFIKIEKDTASGWLSNFRVTDDFGNKAYFGYGYADFESLTYGGSGYISPVMPTNARMTWHISEYRSYTGQRALFEYDTASYDDLKLVSQAYAKRSTALFNNPYKCNCGTSTFNQSTLTSHFNFWIPKKITTPNEEVNFYYSNASTVTFRRRLDSITVKDKDGIVKKRFHFKYGTYTENILRLDGVYEMGLNADSNKIASFHYKDGSLNIGTMKRDIFNYNNGATSNTNIISNTDPACPTIYQSDRTISSTYIAVGTLDTIYYPTAGKVAFNYSPKKSGDTCGPGIRVDSILYINSDGSIASQTNYSYANPQNYYLFNGVVNRTTTNTDNSPCTVKTFYSEIWQPKPFSEFYYANIEIRKKGSSSSSTQLAKESYTPIPSTTRYCVSDPAILKKMVFRNNSLTDTLQLETYTYGSFQYIDSLKMDWIYLADSYLPSRFYSLGSSNYDNTTACNVLYPGVGEYGMIYPGTTLLSKVATKVFDQNTSTLALTNTVNKGYSIYWQDSTESKKTSKGKLDSTIYHYLYTNNDAITSTVKSDNLYGLVDKVSQYTDGGSLLEYSRFHYASLSNSYILPDTLFKKTFTNSEDLDQIITGYDTSGQITEVDNRKGSYTAILRDHNNQLVTAKAIGARLSQVAYTSFEADGKGGWVYSGSLNTSNAITGSKSYDLGTGNITKTGLASANYTVTYWTKNGSAITVNGSSTPSRTGPTISGWTYYEHEVSGTSITISGSNYLDELRLFPKGAQMITYTHKPVIGISSQSDASGRISYFEYDNYGRLKLVRDQNQNILKQYDYKYAAQ